MMIQVMNLLIIPGVVFGLVLLFFKMHMPLNSLLLIGLVIAASTPTTVSSNVVMTKNADGNEASGKLNKKMYFNPFHVWSLMLFLSLCFFGCSSNECSSGKCVG
jgi:hypothetical protein